MSASSSSERPLRIGIVVRSFPKLSETFIVTKVLKLIDAGFDVHVFASSPLGDWDRFEVLGSRPDVRARVHVLPPPRNPAKGARAIAGAAVRYPAELARYVAHNWRTRAGLNDFVRAALQRLHFVGYELDVLHVEFDTQAPGVLDLKDYFGCRLVCSARGTFQHSTVVARMPDATQRIFRQVDGYHFISGFVDENTRRLGLPEDVPTWLIEPAIDLRLFDPAAHPPRREDGGVLRVVSVGRLAWAKGYEFALDAVKRVVDAGVRVRYTIYGEGDYERAIRFGVRQLGLEPAVTLAVIPREEVPRAYMEADVMLHAAVEEGFCNAVIEAQAMELPVVTSDAGGLPENVEDGVTGFVVRRRDADAMAARLLELARAPELRRRMGEAGRARALARFDLDRQADAFARMYRELVALPRRGGARAG